MSIAGIVPGWLIGYLTREDDETCEYRTLSVVSLVAFNGAIEPIVMTPDGRTVRDSEVGLERAFAVGPDDDVEKVAQAHAAGRGRTARAAA